MAHLAARIHLARIPLLAIRNGYGSFSGRSDRRFMGRQRLWRGRPSAARMPSCSRPSKTLRKRRVRDISRQTAYAAVRYFS